MEERAMTTYINGRPAQPWEADALQRAAECERARDLERLAGVLAGDDDRYQPRSPDGRPLTDVTPGWND